MNVERVTSGEKLDRFIINGLRCHNTSIIMGDPGVGKTRAVEHFFKKRKIATHTLIASVIDPTVDITGLSVVANKTVTMGTKEFPVTMFAPRDFLKEIHDKGGVVIVDELTTGRPQVQASLLRPMLDMVFGDLQLDRRRCSIIAIANPPEVAADGQDLEPPMVNRLDFLTYRPDPIEWCNNYPSYWGSPPSLGFDSLNDAKLPEEDFGQARAVYAGAIRSMPDRLHSFPKDRTKQREPWPSPRSHDKACRRLACYLMDGLPVEEAVEEMAGCIGEGPAAEISRWIKQHDLPDAEDVLADPDNFKLPKDGDAMFAVLAGIGQAVINRLDKNRWIAAWKVLRRVATDYPIEIATPTARDVGRLFADNPHLPRPVKEIEPFVPILQEAGLMSKVKMEPDKKKK